MAAPRRTLVPWTAADGNFEQHERQRCTREPPNDHGAMLEETVVTARHILECSAFLQVRLRLGMAFQHGTQAIVDRCSGVFRFE